MLCSTWTSNSGSRICDPENGDRESAKIGLKRRDLKDRKDNAEQRGSNGRIKFQTPTTKLQGSSKLQEQKLQLLKGPPWRSRRASRNHPHRALAPWSLLPWILNLPWNLAVGTSPLHLIHCLCHLCALWDLCAPRDPFASSRPPLNDQPHRHLPEHFDHRIGFSGLAMTSPTLMPGAHFKASCSWRGFFGWCMIMSLSM